MSVLSVSKSLSTDCKPFLHRRFVSLSVSIIKFSGLQNKNRINIQNRSGVSPLIYRKLKYRCSQCGYEAEVYEGRGLFRQEIRAVSCPDCKSIQNIVVGGIIADVAPSYRSEVGRLCLQCGSDNIRIWDGHTCPKCQGEMEVTGDKEFWT